ncbi:MAG: hypothetical protein K6A44_03075 [bacterium]|nr:hypothetical protein [bacterium]
MYPMQCYPNQAQYCNPYAMPQVNAVKIDINNPQAYGGMNSQGQINPVVPQQAVDGTYSYPCSSMYSMPQVSQYTTQAAYPIPPMIAQQAVVPNNAQASPAATPIPVATTVPTPAPVQVMPVPVPVPAPVVPPVPAVPQATPVVNAPVTQNVNVNPSVPAAMTDTKQNTTVAPVAPVQQEVKLPGGVDVNTLISSLSSNNPDEQTAAIQKMAEIAQTDPVAARALLNEQTFGQLVNVINADTSKLQGPTGKPDPKNLSPLEKAEINKQFAVYTLAILQKNFRDEINKEMKKNNLPDIAINDLPYIKEGIVNNLKDNPNPTIREACLSALNYVGRPEDKEVLRVLYDISAKHDSNPAVRTSAKDYLSKLPA